MAAQRMTQGAKKSEVFQKENIGHAYFGQSREMGLKKYVEQHLSLAVHYPHGMISDLSAFSKAPLKRNKPLSVTGLVRW